MIETQIVNQARRQELGKKAGISGAALPYFQLEENTLLTDSTAIARHLIRESPKAAMLLGDSPFMQAQVEQMVALASASVLPAVQTIEATVYGTTINPEAHAMSLKSLKETCKVLNQLLTDKNWICGSSITFADVHLFTSLAPAFQICLDAGFRKAMPALATWFEKMSKLPAIVGRLGHIRPCAKSLAPVKK